MSQLDPSKPPRPSRHLILSKSPYQSFPEEWGDIASARLLLKRAANAGNAQAAELGMTFDLGPTTGGVQPRAKLTPTPDTRPTTIEGWTVREVIDGTAVLEGPSGS